MFEVGDIVECVGDDGGKKRYIKKGNIYTVSRVYKDGGTYFIYVDGYDEAYLLCRFKLAQPISLENE